MNRPVPQGTAARWIAFAAVGMLGFAVQMGAFVALTRLAAWPYPIATALAVEMAVLHNFVWHQRWTWADRPTAGAARRLLQFNVTNGLTSIFGNVALTGAFVELLGVRPEAAVLLAVISLAVANFVAADRWVFRPLIGGACVFTLIALGPRCASASQPGSDTLAAWQHYVALVEKRLEAEAQSAQTVDRRAVLAGGAILVSDLSAGGSAPPSEAPSATIQHWRGAVFVAGVTLDQLLDRLEREPPDGDGVVSARILARAPGWVRVHVRLVRRQIVAVTYDTDHETVFHRRSSLVATSRSVMTKIAEVDDAGTPDERARPPEEERGFLWRWQSYGRYTSVADGVVVEIESVTLSRGVPLLIRPLAAPIISHFARESMRSTLDALRRRLRAG